MYGLKRNLEMPLIKFEHYPLNGLIQPPAARLIAEKLKGLIDL